MSAILGEHRVLSGKRSGDDDLRPQRGVHEDRRSDQNNRRDDARHEEDPFCSELGCWNWLFHGGLLFE